MDKRPIQILVLEDEPVLRDLLAMILIREGFKVLVGGSREEGETILSIMGWSWMDLVIADANLDRDPAVLEGYSFHAFWRKLYPVPSFIFMHGYDRVPELADERDCRVFHLMKPFAPSSLISLIQTILDG